ncbi:uncharacterized protein BYT42DRAFT_590387 [Radiomyces spectabilis]|uniref:uncharacterized protein n=1 Tax=Radiomyces spectabilis TaxID=64574 RepID=UPI00221F73C7|nr:uncharacterized protein BYT42DRAFT_590387 [Radiomyces spectabilis]KAI8364771.1 hypothetical protein BYT42DRAFT_590387 [Radiomyces spectabilis]
MSGDSPSLTGGRFTPINKKYPGSPKSSAANSNMAGNRNANARARLLTSKITAPRPINLPSLRRENAGSETPASQSSINTGWGSPSGSPFASPQSKQADVKSSTQLSPSEPFSVSPTLSKAPITSSSPSLSTATALSSSPKQSTPSISATSPPVATRAWAVPSTVPKKPSFSSSDTSDFPTAAEAAAGHKHKENQPVTHEKKPEEAKLPSSDPSPGTKHAMWDEMVSEDLDYSVSVVEFDDGTKVALDPTEEEPEDISGTAEFVSPAERFTEDYDRSYPPQLRSIRDEQMHPLSDESHRQGGQGHFRSYRHDQNDKHGSPYHRWTPTDKPEARLHPYGAERRSSNMSTGERGPWGRPPISGDGHRRDSAQSIDSERNPWGRGRPDRRPSQEHKSGFHPTLLQRPRRPSEHSARSEHSHDERGSFHAPDANSPAGSEALRTSPPKEPFADRPPEVAAAQREVMLTAAERAKKRRDEEEAEFEAARERARQKALALARDSATKEPKETKEAKEAKDESKDAKPKQASSNPSSTSPASEKAKPSMSSERTPSPANATTKSSPSDKDAVKRELSWVQIVDPKKRESPSFTKSPAATEKEQDKPSTVDTASEPPKPMPKDWTEDDIAWENYVKTVKSSSNDANAPIKTGVSEWNSFASRLQQSTRQRRQQVTGASVAEESKESNETPVQQRTTPAPRGRGRGAHGEDREQSVSQDQDRGRGKTWDNRRSGNGRSRDSTDLGATTPSPRVSKGRGETSDTWRRASAPKKEEPSLQGVGISSPSDETAVSPELTQPSSSVQPSSDTLKKPSSDVITETEEPMVTASTTAPAEKHPSAIQSKPSTTTTKSGPSRRVKRSMWSKEKSLLHRASAPIFPEAVERIAANRPALLKFTVDTDSETEEEASALLEPQSHTVAADTVVEEEVVAVSIPLQQEQEKVASAELGTESTSLTEAIVSDPTNNSTTPSTVSSFGASSLNVSNPATAPSVAQQSARGRGRKMEGMAPGYADPNMMASNPNYPFLVYQFPASEGAGSPSRMQAFTGRSEQQADPFMSPVNKQQGASQPPLDIYLMPPPQQYMSNGQYLPTFPQTGTGNMRFQPVYVPRFQWNAAPGPQRPHAVSPTMVPPRPQSRRPYHAPRPWQYTPSNTDTKYTPGTSHSPPSFESMPRPVWHAHPAAYSNPPRGHVMNGQYRPRGNGYHRGSGRGYWSSRGRGGGPSVAREAQASTSSERSS